MLDCRPNHMRRLLLESSSVKLKDSSTSGKTDVTLFIFTDMMLICKKSPLTKKSSSSSHGHIEPKLRVIRPPMLVDRIIVLLSDHSSSDSNLHSTTMSSSMTSNLTSRLHHSSSTSSHHPHVSLVYVNEFNVAVQFLTLYCSEVREVIDGIRKAQKRYQEAKLKAVLANYNYLSPNSASMYRTMDDDDSEGTSSGYIVNYVNNNNPSAVNLNQDHQHHPILLLTSNFHCSTSGRSSRSSLMPSYSGSIEMSEGAMTPMGSNLQIVPPPPSATPNLFYVVGSTTPSQILGNPSRQSHFLSQDGQTDHPSRARSFELGDLRNPSLSVDNEAFGRSHSMETRSSICVTVTSPRPERRAFLLRGSGSGSPYSSCNTLNVPNQRVVVPQTSSQSTTKGNSSSVQATGQATQKLPEQPKPISKVHVQQQLQQQPITPKQTSSQQQPPPPPPRTPASRSQSVGPTASQARVSQAPLQHQQTTVKPPPPRVPPRKTPPTGVSTTPVLTRCLSPVNKPPLVKTKNVPPTPPSPSISLKQVESVTDTPGLVLLSYKRFGEDDAQTPTSSRDKEVTQDRVTREVVNMPSLSFCLSSSCPTSSRLYQKRSNSRQENSASDKSPEKGSEAFLDFKEDQMSSPQQSIKASNQQLNHRCMSTASSSSGMAQSDLKSDITNPFVVSSSRSSSGISSASSSSTHFPFHANHG